LIVQQLANLFFYQRLLLEWTAANPKWPILRARLFCYVANVVRLD
jgi:hypothetical protein